MSQFSEIPIIDFSLLEGQRQKFLDSLHHAIVEVGFLYVKNTTLSTLKIEALKQLLPHLFKISEQEKASIELENSPHFLGFSAVGSETTAGHTDLREQFEFISQQNDTWKPGRPLYERLVGPNQYPSSLPKAQTIVEDYMDEVTAFAEDFMLLVAEALQLPKDTFLPYLSHANRMKIVRYPETSDGRPSQGVGPHKDSSGWWTFLLQASPPEVKGLQVLNKAGDWIDVPNLPGTLVVNIGQAFEVITHGYCKATTHRVAGGAVERFSVPLFLGVRGDLTKDQALGGLRAHFTQQSGESVEAAAIDSGFLRGNYDTWGESLLRTKIRSHRKAGERFYPEVYDRYIHDS